MRFNSKDVKPNTSQTMDQTRAAFSGDLRWRGIPAKVRVIDIAEAMRRQAQLG